MEWVETTGSSIELALDAALDELGVDEDEVEFEVLEQPKAGLFGRIGANPARIRARVKPLSREKPGERNRGRGGRQGRRNGGRDGGRGGARNDGRKDAGRAQQAQRAGDHRRRRRTVTAPATWRAAHRASVAKASRSRAGPVAKWAGTRLDRATALGVDAAAGSVVAVAVPGAAIDRRRGTTT